MKKLFALTLLGLGLLTSSGAFAQEPAVTPARTLEIIASIPTLQSIATEIADFGQKKENSKEELKNADADLRALKMKYAAELEVQIALNKDNAEIVEALTAELAKTRTEIELLK